MLWQRCIVCSHANKAFFEFEFEFEREGVVDVVCKMYAYLFNVVSSLCCTVDQNSLRLLQQKHEHITDIVGLQEPDSRKINKLEPE